MAKKRPTTPPLSPTGSISKHVMLERWKNGPERRPLRPRPIPYGHTGSTIDEDGIRICGTLEFVEAVMSHLKPLLKFEAGATRLGLSCSELSDRGTAQRLTGRFRCAIQVHQRSRDAATTANGYDLYDEDSPTPAGLATRPRKNA